MLDAMLLSVIAEQVLLCLSLAKQQSITVDGIFQVTGGFAFNKLHDICIHADNGGLPQRNRALAAVVAGALPFATGQAPFRNNQPLPL